MLEGQRILLLSRFELSAGLVSLIQQLLPSAALTLRVPPVRRFLISVDELVREALFGNPASA